MKHNTKNVPQGLDQAKDFKGSIVRLMNELKSFRILIISSLILASLGSILSIFAPDKLSELTDEISLGLVVNSNNLQTISDKITSNLDEESLKEEIPKILNINLNGDIISKVMSSDISDEDKNNFSKILENKSFDFSSLSDSVLNVILADSTYNEIKVSVQDKKELLKLTNNIKFFPNK